MKYLMALFAFMALGAIPALSYGGPGKNSKDTPAVPLSEKEIVRQAREAFQKEQKLNQKPSKRLRDRMQSEATVPPVNRERRKE